MTAPVRGSDVRRWQCRWCASRSGDVVVDLGVQPAADHFPRPIEPLPDPRHELQMVCCRTCRLAQLASDTTVPDEPRGLEPRALVEQAGAAIDAIAAAGVVVRGRTVLEHSSPHGGSWLPELAARGLVPVTDGPADIVIDVFGMMHEPDQAAALRRRVSEMAPGATLLVQFHSLAAIVRDRMWNALRHGHFAYYSTPTLVDMASVVGLTAVQAWTFALYGGTVLLALRRDGELAGAVRMLVDQEVEAGAVDAATLGQLQATAASACREFDNYVRDCCSRGLTVAGYGAASRSVALLNMAERAAGRLIGVADAAEAKWGRTIPGVRIRIFPPAEMMHRPPDRVVLFVPDLLDEVRAVLPQIEASGGRWVLLDPSPAEAAPVVRSAGQPPPSVAAARSDRS